MQLTARRANFFFWLEILCAIGLVAMLGASYLAIVGRDDPGELVPSGQAAAMLVATLIPALGIVVLWGRRIAIRRAGGTTARLHVNLVFFFSLIAAIPTLLVAVFASFLFQSGVEFWFSREQRGILENASELARGYYDENQRDVGNNALAMAGDVRYFLQQGSITSSEFEEFFPLQVYWRELNESAILQQDASGALQVLAIVDPDQDADRERIDTDTLTKLRQGESVVVRPNGNRLEAVTTLDQAQGVYLYIARNADPDDLAQYERAQRVLQAYDDLSRQARLRQLNFNLALFAVALVLVGLAVWAALRFADRQVRPLTQLASVAREIGAGNYAMRVEGRTGPDEIGLLNRAFNRMSAQIQHQTDELLGANRQLAERRAFIEAVLQSITAGIISVDASGKVLLMNASAQRVLQGEGSASPIGVSLADIAPQIATMVENGASSGLVQYSREGELLTLALKLAPSSEGHVITFEDITRQLVAQRQAAWSDVARRIAHEIKNPLTPIQLATERIKRRYSKQIETDAEPFDELTGTIIRQVGDLRKMVDEFSSFARLPKPVFRQEDSVDLVRQAMFLQEVANPEINYAFAAEGQIPQIECDRHQFGQAMTNVMKNAAEAVEARAREEGEGYRGRISVEMGANDTLLTVTVTDNGVGLPKTSESILEPYVTTREKGTGLGLAIVKKIVEEHGGDLAFSSAAEGRGTIATLRFALAPTDFSSGSEPAE